MQPFYQGKIDNFCAMYAVLNALQVLFNLGPLQARRIFNRTLSAQAADPEEFSRILEHRTDYTALVDFMLDDVRRHEFPALQVRAPFDANAGSEEVWETLRSCARPPMPLVSVFRFLRIAPPSEKPYVDHWTVGHYMDMEGLHFLDCSLEAGALYCLPYAKLTDAWRPLSREYVVIPPESVRILSHARSFGLPL
ncbi:hypothetical protein [Mailhella massiliensis]|uniref:Uncharacterized protein n=1 Tax=Mailhella massiliensis TaxID=1903261 RepID=A0A921AUF4_9BACT|nr:hypothetical protein [Mailhella massiliensis]HJD96338.1 hypothetical protein [Mailhella massiliensis]